MNFKGKKVFDISPEVSSETAVFPGDTVFSQNILLDCSKGDNFGLSAITTTPHVGAHVDAPKHYHADGVGISERNVQLYLGPCQVVEVALPRGERILSKHVANKNITSPRVLFKTKSFPNPNHWNGDFNALSVELIQKLSDFKVCLVGIDTPSVDLAEDKNLEVHHAIYERDMAILEGIVLDNVPEGNYQLIALPLKLKNLDASPVRAVLVAE